MTGLYSVSSGSIIQSQDINQLVTAFPFFNIKSYNAVVDGSTDDASAINTTITQAGAAGGGFVLIPGLSAINSPINLNVVNVILIAVGAGSGLRPKSSFSGAEIINITADFCGVKDMKIAYTNTTYSGNPAANGIEITGARHTLLQNVDFNYINGYCVESAATAGVANYWAKLFNVHSFQCGQGIHILGVTGSSFNMAHFLRDCNMDQIQNGDSYFFEDAHDIVCSNLYSVISAGSGSELHIKGASAAIYVSNMDLGPAPGPSTGPTVLIETGTNGDPKQVTLEAGVVEGGTPGISVTAGTEIKFQGLDLFNNGTHGISLSGSCDAIVKGCTFSSNGSTAGAGRYDFNSTTSGRAKVQGCIFKTPQGSLTGQTNNAVNATTGTVDVQGNTFTTTTPFNGFPKYIRNNPGYNPVGNTSVSLPASGTAFATKSSDLTYYVTGGTVSTISIGGVNTGLTSGAFRVTAQQTFNITYTVAPTVTAFAD